jgi:hypothetical protein
MRAAPFGGSRWAIPLLALILAFGGAGCKPHQVAKRATDEGPPARLASVVAMGDAAAAGQLLSGFHSIEAGAWRWTERRFSISLARPLHADQSGATLTVRLTVPPVSIEKLKSLQLSATVNGKALDPETYTAPGEYIYRRALPASLLSGDPVRVDFSLDKAIPPGTADLRELGIVVLAIGLEAR